MSPRGCLFDDLSEGVAATISEQELFPDQPPRLMVAINCLELEPDRLALDVEIGAKVKVPDEGGDPIFSPAGATHVSDILAYVEQTFRGSGLEDAWAHDAGKDGRVDGLDGGDEDVWAKQVTEMFLFSGYGGPAVQSSFPVEFVPQWSQTAPPPHWDGTAYVYQRLQLDYVPHENWPKVAPGTPKVDWNELRDQLASADTTETTDPAYSLITACQHITTYLLTTRGYTIEKDMFGAGFLASPAISSFPVFRDPGQWVTASTARSVGSALLQHGAGPGSIYVFNHDSDGQQQSGAHIWGILRVRKAATEVDCRLQNFEGANTTETLPPPKNGHARQAKNAHVAHEGGGRFDTPWWSQVVGPSPCQGLGVPKPPSRLSAAIELAKKARPVGLARLVVSTRGGPGANAELVYVSHLVRLWGDDEMDNYTSARLLLSLRNTPYFGSYAVRWFLFAPVGVLAEAMWTEGRRGWPAVDFIAEALRLKNERLPVDQRLRDGSLRYKTLTTAEMRCALVLTHDADGLSKVEYRFHDSQAVVPKGGVLGAIGNFIVLPDGTLYQTKGVGWDGEWTDPRIAKDGVKVEVPELLLGLRYEPPTAPYDPVEPHGGRPLE